MNTTVDFETAKELSKAGLPQPGYPIPNQSEVVGKLFYSPAGNKFLGCWQEVDNSITLQPFLHNKEIDGVINVVFAPTALEIIEQMPEGSSIQTSAEGAGWICRLKIDALNYVIEQDVCPHKAAAKAYITWKKGMV